MLVIRDDSATYENLEFDTDNYSAAKQQIETFLYRCNAPKTYTLIESGMLARLSRASVWLSPCAFGIAGAIAFCRSARLKRSRPKAALLHYAASAVMMAIALVILFKTFYWPQSFLPTKWSDFGFWRELIKDWNAQAKMISLMTPHPKEIQLFAALRWGAVLELTSLLSGGWCMAVVRRCRGNLLK